ncbi:hypothetical protein [Nocardioides daeguensis]|uniref:DUF3267 domain-containing protein n=1 Tax=Nocardioides daeguensis TaxID=908359 RepID=A0ABP6W878_9ACTN|nr:hypothetical protein [Nocardioides daeguensis]MCR1773562.1 hypothetical protein [Nocardioides daeguensis]
MSRDPVGTPDPAQRRARRARPWEPVPGAEPGEVVYGVIVSAATIGAVGLHVHSNARLGAIWAFVVLTYWLAHVYVHLVAHPLRGVRVRVLRRVRTALRDELGVLVGALPGLAILLVVALLGGEPATTASVTLFVTIGLLFGLGTFAALRVGASLVYALGEGLLASTLGVLMVVAKALLH